MKNSKSTRQETIRFLSQFLEDVRAYLRRHAANAARYFREVVVGVAQPATEPKGAPVPKAHKISANPNGLVQ